MLKILPYALEGSKSRWEVYFECLRQRDPYGYDDFNYSIAQVPGYVGCIHDCGPKWLGLRFHFPLIWFPMEKYQYLYKLTKKVEKQWWEELVSCEGYKKRGE